jgi:hypothetical protein
MPTIINKPFFQTLRKFDQNASQQTLGKFDQNASQQTLGKFDQNAPQKRKLYQRYN